MTAGMHRAAGGAIRKRVSPASSPGGLVYAGGPPAHLFLHGFTATPEELRFLAEASAQSGFQTLAPLLPGHGTSPEELAAVRWEDWFRATTEAAVHAGAEHVPIVVVGQSLGGLLALHLAATKPHWVAALVLLAPAVFLRQWWIEALAPVYPVLACMKPYWPKGTSDIADPAGIEARVAYDVVPLRAVRELVELQQIVRREVAGILQPTLIVQSQQDHTCLWKGVEFLAAHLRGPVETLALQRSFHVVSLDYERSEVAAAIRRFVGKLS